jgi:hypothetical protein
MLERLPAFCAWLWCRAWRRPASGADARLCVRPARLDHSFRDHSITCFAALDRSEATLFCSERSDVLGLGLGYSSEFSFLVSFSFLLDGPFSMIL